MSFLDLPPELLTGISLCLESDIDYTALCCVNTNLSVLLQTIRQEYQGLRFLGDRLLSPFQLACVDELLKTGTCIVPYDRTTSSIIRSVLQLRLGLAYNKTEYTLKGTGKPLPVDQYTPIWIYCNNKSTLTKIFQHPNVGNLGKVFSLCKSQKCKSCEYSFPCSCIDTSKYKSIRFGSNSIDYDSLKEYDTIICYACQTSEVSTLLMTYSRRPKKIISFDFRPTLNPNLPSLGPMKHRYVYDQSFGKKTNPLTRKRRFFYNSCINYAELAVLSSIYSYRDRQTAIDWCKEVAGTTTLSSEDFDLNKDNRYKKDTYWLYLDPLAELSSPVLCYPFLEI